MARTLLNFLREYDFETLYIVGDLIDIWSMRRGRYWPQQHTLSCKRFCAKRAKVHGLFISRAINTNNRDFAGMAPAVYLRRLHNEECAR